MSKKVSDHVILYLDILGYSSLLENCIKHDKTEDYYLQQIDSLMSSLAFYINDRNKRIDEKSPGLGLSRFNYRIFSDNIVFFAPVESIDDPLKFRVDRDNLFGNLLYGLSEFLFAYNKSEIFFRGAVTCGPLYYNESSDSGLLFGTGLIRAHYLENDVAIYPRILIDECFGPDGLLTGIARDYDGVGFLDYLRLANAIVAHANGYEVGSQEAVKLTAPYIMSFFESIKSALMSYANNPKVYRNYTYLAMYLNRFCKNNGFSEHSIPIG